jgi:soluble lytic murein transglycosylase
MRPRLFSFLLIVMLLTLPAAEAAMYSFVDQYGRLHFSNVPADPRYREVPGYEALRNAAVHGHYGKFIRAAAERYGLDPELIKAVIKVESSFDPAAVSEKGAMGLMQLMPATAEEMQVRAPFEAEENIMGGSRYLRKLLDLFEGDLQLGLAAYNAGPSRVLENGAIPNIPETEQYVKKVLQEYGRTRANGMARQ